MEKDRSPSPMLIDEEPNSLDAYDLSFSALPSLAIPHFLSGDTASPSPPLPEPLSPASAGDYLASFTLPPLGSLNLDTASPSPPPPEPLSPASAGEYLASFTLPPLGSLNLDTPSPSPVDPYEEFPLPPLNLDLLHGHSPSSSSSSEDEDVDMDYQPPPIRRPVMADASSEERRPAVQSTTGTYGWPKFQFLPPDLLMEIPEAEVITGYVLDSILDSLKYNAPATWIDQMSLDTFLTLERSRHPLDDLCTLYVPMEYHHSQNLPDEDQIHTYNQRLPYPNDVASHLLSTLVHHSDHFFGVFLHPAERAVYIFGQHVNRSYTDTEAGKEWESWHGPHVLTSLCLLHDLPTFTPRVIVGINWEQPGGTECGAECGETLFVTQCSPLLFRADGIPRRPSHRCTHRFRLHMLLTLHETCSAALVRFCSTTVPDDQATAAELRRKWLNQPNALEKVLNNPRNSIRRAMALCARCQQDEVPMAGVQESVLPDKLTVDAFHPPTLRDLRHAFPEFSEARLSLAIQAVTDGEEEVNEAAEEEAALAAANPEVVELSMSHHRKTTLRDAAAAEYRKFPHPIPTPVPPTVSLRGRRLPFHHTYDAYDEGPSLIATRLIPEDFGFLVHPHIYTYLRPTGIEQGLNPNPFPTEWADFGYRLLPDFAQSFDITNFPWNPADHLFPELPSSFTGTAEYEVELDCQTVSLASFNSRSERKPLLPLTGVAVDNPRLYLRVDPELDFVTPDHIQLDCDIDSFIAVGRDLPFIDTITLHSLPQQRRRAPLSVNNHVYVDVLLPRSEYDIQASKRPHRKVPHEDGVSRGEWWTKSYPLSNIPHFELGSFPKRGGQLLVFFPRMIHRQMYNAYHATNIPYDLKTLFYERLFYPGIQHAKPRSEHQYWIYSNVILTHKMGKSKSSGPLDISPEQFKAATDFMREKASILQLIC